MEGVGSGPVRLRLLIAITGIVAAAVALLQLVGMSREHGVVGSLVRLALWLG